MIAKLFALWLFYLLVSGQLATWVGFATTSSQASNTSGSSGGLPSLPTLPGG